MQCETGPAGIKRAPLLRVLLCRRCSFLSRHHSCFEGKKTSISVIQFLWAIGANEKFSTTVNSTFVCYLSYGKAHSIEHVFCIICRSWFFFFLFFLFAQVMLLHLSGSSDVCLIMICNKKAEN